MAALMPRYVLLDRDGTVIVERHYLADYRLVELLPGAAEGLRLMNETGMRLAIVSNQSGIGRGYFSREQLDQVHERMLDLLSDKGVVIDGIFYCPHTPEDGCSCRKPEDGMIRQAVRELGFSAADAFVVGDKSCDVELGKKVNATTVLVRTGYGAKTESEKLIKPDYILNDLLEAALTIRRLAG